jgi:glycosyltransferase involved in cell wall biosynthesis/peptidoglycan/xylan/chitin deacetylase (PgdA/CDA1 family)
LTPYPSDLPSFSIVIPTYQRREVVTKAICALCRTQYAAEIEIIVVVDGSTDGTARSLKEIQAPFPLRIIEQPNRGAAHARNQGAAEARHDILLFVDDDMICEPDMVAEHARSLSDGADAVIGETVHDPDSPPGFMSDSIEEWLGRAPGPLTLFDVWTGQLSIRRSVFEEIGGFDETFTDGEAFANEDADLGIKLLDRYNVRRNPEAISHQHYVVSPRELMRRAPLRAVGDIRLARKHPSVARALFEARGISRWSTRAVFGPLSAVPLFPQLLAAFATSIADIGLRTPLKSSRILSRFFLGSRAILYWASLRRFGWYPLSSRLLVLSYHAIQDWTDDSRLAPYGTPPEQFAAQLRSLSDRRYQFVSPNAVAAYLADDAPLPKRAVLLTFDDGYSDLLGIASKILRPRRIQALAFVVTGLSTTTNEWDERDGCALRRLLSREELKELAGLGVELGAHSRTHPHMALLSYDQRDAETSGAASDIETLGVPRPRFFAYPYGEVDPASEKAVRDAGYLAGFGIDESWVDRKSDRFNLPRVIVHSTDRGRRFDLMTSSPRLYEALLKVRKRLKTTG